MWGFFDAKVRWGERKTQSKDQSPSLALISWNEEFSFTDAAIDTTFTPYIKNIDSEQESFV